MGQKNKNPAQFLTKGTLAKTGQPYEMVLQGAGDIDAILDLQKIAMDDLSDEEKSYLVPKDRAFFEKHFASGNLMLGIISEGKLVAQCVIVNPTKQSPKTGMTDMPGRLAPHRVTVIQGVIVHPDYRGNRLMSEMVDVWLEIARMQGRRHAISEVTVDNHFSWAVFMKEGLQLHSIGYDPDDAVHLYNMHAEVSQLIEQRLNIAFNQVAAPPPSQKAVPVSLHELDKQRALIKKGFKGVARNPKTGEVIFDKPKKQIFPWKKK